MQAIKQNCSTLAHLPVSNIRVRYRDEDGDMNNLSEDPDDFAFGEMLRSAEVVKDRGTTERFSSGKRSRFTVTEKAETNERENAEFFSF